MAIKITVSPRLKFKVKGTIKDEAGHDQPFDFSLTADRIDADAILDKVRDADTSVVDFMLGVVHDWAGVKDADDRPLPYSEDNYRALCRIPGIAQVAFRTYLAEAGAKEKN